MSNIMMITKLAQLGDLRVSEPVAMIFIIASVILGGLVMMKGAEHA
jgi:hypothetical protein